MNPIFRQAVDCVDLMIGWLSLAFMKERSCLIIPMFHGIYPGRASTESGAFDSQQGITIDQFRAVVSSFAASGCQFIRPEDIDSGLDEGNRYVMLTFDDGYFNNASVLPILEEFGVPAVFFVSVSHVLQGKAFWWDVLHREARSAKMADAEIDAIRFRCKTMRTEEAEDFIKAKFKLNELRPASDLDRPMTPAELSSFSRSKFVVIGNHTLDHAILTNYSANGIREQIEGCQDALQSITGVQPSCIAYPNGNCSTAVIKAALGAGLTTGVVAYSGRNAVPLPPDADARMKLMRVVPWGNRNIKSQCKVFQSRYSLYRTLVYARSVRKAQRYENL